MFGRPQRKKLAPITKRRFFTEIGAGYTLYCFFAWYMLAYTSMKHLDLYGSSGGDTTEFSLVFFGSIIVYVLLGAATWFWGRKRFPEKWLTKDTGILAGVWIGGILAGLLVFYIIAKVTKI